MTERSSPNIVAISFLAGLAGMAAGLLLAPRSGAETRQKLKDRADELKDQAETGLNNAKDTVSSGLDKLTAAINTTSKKAKDEYEEMKDKKNRPAVRQSPVLHAWEEEI